MRRSICQSTTGREDGRLWGVATGAGARTARMVRGTVLTHRRRCGKANCRCADGENLHESVVLSYSQGSKTRFVMLPAAEVAAVRAATERFRSAKARLDAKGEQGLAELVARLRPAKGR